MRAGLGFEFLSPKMKTNLSSWWALRSTGLYCALVCLVDSTGESVLISRHPLARSHPHAIPCPVPRHSGSLAHLSRALSCDAPYPSIPHRPRAPPRGLVPGGLFHGGHRTARHFSAHVHVHPPQGTRAHRAAASCELSLHTQMPHLSVVRPAPHPAPFPDSSPLPPRGLVPALF